MIPAKFTYLFINALTIVFPLILSFDRRVQFYKKWRFLWPGMLITGLVFLGWDMVFVVEGVWRFNDQYTIGVNINNLPIEEILFFFTVPFSCVFVYACLNYYIRLEIPELSPKPFTGGMILLSLGIIILCFNRVYTLVTFGFLMVLLLYIQYIRSVKWMGKFYRAYIVCLLPFFIINGLLTAIPVVEYNDHRNLGVRLWTIPLEDMFYMMALLLMNIAFFEYFSKRAKPVVVIADE